MSITKKDFHMIDLLNNEDDQTLVEHAEAQLQGKKKVIPSFRDTLESICKYYHEHKTLSEKQRYVLAKFLA
jgi:hypothetical protein